MRMAVGTRTVTARAGEDDDAEAQKRTRQRRSMGVFVWCCVMQCMVCDRVHLCVSNRMKHAQLMFFFGCVALADDDDRTLAGTQGSVDIDDARCPECGVRAPRSC